MEGRFLSKYIKNYYFLLLLFFLNIPLYVFPKTYKVGKGKEFKDLEKVFKLVQSGDKIKIYPGKYITRKMLELNNKNNIFISGIGKVEIICREVAEIILRISHCKNIRINNLSIRHKSKPDTHGCTGDVVYIFKCLGIHVENCDLAGCGYNGVYAYSSMNIFINRNYIHDNTNAGITMNSCSNVSIINNEFANNPVDLNFKETDNISKIGNNFAGKRVVYNKIIIKPGISEEKIRRIFQTLSSGDKIIVQSGKYIFTRTLRLRFRKNIEIIGRGKVEFVHEDLFSDVFIIDNCNNILIKNITMYHQKKLKHHIGCKGTVLFINKCSKMKIIQCSLNGCGAIGLYCRDSNNIELKNSRIFNNSSVGIVINSCRQVSIKNNEIYNNTQSFVIFNSTYIILENNNIRNTKFKEK